MNTLAVGNTFFKMKRKAVLEAELKYGSSRKLLQHFDLMAQIMSIKGSSSTNFISAHESITFAIILNVSREDPIGVSCSLENNLTNIDIKKSSHNHSDSSGAKLDIPDGLASGGRVYSFCYRTDILFTVQGGSGKSDRNELVQVIPHHLL